MIFQLNSSDLRRCTSKSCLGWTLLLAVALSGGAAWAGEPTGIVLYSNPDFTGDRLVINEQALDNLGDYGWNDRAQSFVVYGGDWVLYDDDAFSGDDRSGVYGPFSAGSYTVPAVITSLRRMPEKGITFFADTYLRGFAKNVRRNMNFTLRADNPGPGEPFNNRWSSAWVPDTEVGHWTAFDGIGSGDFEFFGSGRTGAIHILELNDRISSVYTSQIGSYTEVEAALTDDRLLRPQERIALDSFSRIPTRVVTEMQIRTNGYHGMEYTEASGYAFYHPQHMIRLPNKDGRAYFMVTLSGSNANLDHPLGYMAVFRMDDDALDPATDRVIDTPGTDGEYVYSQVYDPSSPYGDWNHPGKMGILGDVVVIAAEQWGSKFGEARDGDALDAVLFYDVRDPERPRFWGQLNAFELGVNIQVDSDGDPSVERFPLLSIQRRAISKVSLNRLGDDILLFVGNNTDSQQRIFRARNGVVQPYINAWEFVGTGGVAGAHGMNFVSLEQNGFRQEPGEPRLMFFDGAEAVRKPRIDGPSIPSKVLLRTILFTPAGGSEGSIRVPDTPGFTASKDVVVDDRWPYAGLVHKGEDTAGLYVTEFGRPVIYAPESRDARAPRREDMFFDVGIGGVQGDLINGLRGSPTTGYYNRYVQLHTPDTYTQVQADDPGGVDRVLTFTVDGDVIDFAAGANGQTFHISVNKDINKRVMIDASELPDGVTLSGLDAEEVFRIGSGGHLHLINVTVTGANASALGAIFNEGTLVLDNSRIMDNPTRGLLNAGTAVLLGSTISGNQDNGGAGILNDGGTVFLRDVTVSGNDSSNDGGGILTLDGRVTGFNCTLSGNTATAGSGIRITPVSDPDARLELTHCTVDGDLKLDNASAEQVSLRNTLATAIEGDFSSPAPNMTTAHSGINAGPAALTVVADLGLGLLMDNDGDTQTLMPDSGSPAIDAGELLTDLRFDQRGAERVVPDLGAAETPDLNLKTLAINGTALMPELDPLIASYAVRTSFRNVNRLRASETGEDQLPARIIEYRVNGGAFELLADPETGREIQPELDLSVGSNTVEVRVSIADRSLSKLYTIDVEREPPGSNADLQWLADETMTLAPTFDPSITAYDAGTTARTSLRFWAQAVHSTSGVEIRVNGGPYQGVLAPDQLDAGFNHSLAIDGRPRVRGWGSSQAVTGGAEVGQDRPPLDLVSPDAVAAGGSHSLFLDRGGEVRGWGANDQGQIDVPTLEGVLEVATGLNHSLALRSVNGGTVVAWGSNSHGQTDVPPGLTDVVRIAAGRAHSVALKLDGTVVAWGDNSVSQLDIPPGLNDVVAIAAGYDATLALKADGTVERWGATLSNGLTNVPSNLVGVVDVSAGGDGAQDVNLALKGDGSVVGWGALADCDIESVVDSVADISAGGRHRVAVLENGRLFAWGANNFGQTATPLGAIIGTPGSHRIDLLPGANLVEVRVTAEDGTTKVYAITVTQDDDAVADQFELAPSALSSVPDAFFENVNLIGLSVHYRVTGSVAGEVYGGQMGQYNLFSDIASTAVHAGVLADGEAGIVSLRIIQSPQEFTGFEANGVSSRNVAFQQNPDPATAFEIRRFTSDPGALLRQQYDVEPGLPPADLRCFGNRIGETLNFLVYGNAPADPDNPPSQQVLWYQASQDRYAHDSPLAVAAVHAGILQPGELGVVAVTIGEGFSFVSFEEQEDTQMRNGVIPARRGDNHSSFVGGSYQLAPVAIFGADDADGDGIDDQTEAMLMTDPFNPDSDGDGLPDGWELEYGTNPLVDDSADDPDMDGLNNATEYQLGTDPMNTDSDGDGLPDEWEVANGLNPAIADGDGDPDNDGLTNAQEFAGGTHPLQWNAPVAQTDVIFGSGFESGENQAAPVGQPTR